MTTLIRAAKETTFKAPGLRLSPQVWLAFCMASISIYCHNNKRNKKWRRGPQKTPGLIVRGPLGDVLGLQD